MLKVNEWTMAVDKESKFSDAELAEIKAARPSQKMPQKIYARKKARILADKMIATANGTNLTFRSEAAPVITPNQEHLEFRFSYGLIGQEIDRSKPIEFQFNDTNFESVSGKLWLVLKADSGLTVIDRLIRRSPRTLAFRTEASQEEKLRRASAIFELPKKSAPSEPTPAMSAGPSVDGERPGLIEDLFGRGLTALFDSDAGHWVAFARRGALRHGPRLHAGARKTLVAAYLVGERGTIRHACVLGLSTTLAHTGSVIGIAVVALGLYAKAFPKRPRAGCNSAAAG